MTTNNNLRYTVDFYPASVEEESDPDPSFHAEGMSLGTIYADLAEHVGSLAVIAVYLDRCDETDETRYTIHRLADPQGPSLGVAYVATEELTPGA
ncbi:hypothetical protein SEA_NOSHOW_38 [Mycobacterium phage NoShow]|nr:hypothetical protein SEA_NOSHOW_38 [Mycobacterium phage NoShow]